MEYIHILLLFLLKEVKVAVSKVRKKTKGKPRGSIKRIPKVYSIKYKYMMGDYNPKLDRTDLYINMTVNEELVVVRGFVDPDKSYFDGLYIHTPNPNPNLTAQTAFISKKDAPNLLMVVRAYTDTLGDILDSGETETPRLSVNNKGVYMSDSDLYDFAKVY